MKIFEKEKAGGISSSYLSFVSSKITMWVAGVAQLVEIPLYKQTRSRIRFQMESLKFFIDIILPAAQWPWSWLSL